MESFNRVKGNGPAPISPVPRRGLGIIKGIVRLARDDLHESECGLMVAAGGETEIDMGGGGMVGDHASEHVG